MSGEFPCESFDVIIPNDVYLVPAQIDRGCIKMQRFAGIENKGTFPPSTKDAVRYLFIGYHEESPCSQDSLISGISRTNWTEEIPTCTCSISALLVTIL